MRKDYPVVKNNTVRLSVTYRWRTRSGSSSSGVCRVEDIKDRQVTVVLPNKVELGKSPSSWRRNIEVGESATSTLVGTMYGIKGGEGLIGLYGDGVPNHYQGCFIDERSGQPLKHFLGADKAPLDETLSLLADERARADLLAKYLRVRKQWRGGNFIAEFRDTVKMLKRPVFGLKKGFERFIENVRRARGERSRKRYAGYLSDAWLSWTFGWSPLFSDIRAASEALARLEVSGRFDGKIIKGVGTDDDSIVYSPGVYMVGTLLNRHDKLQSAVDYVACIKARPDCFRSVADTFGISPTDVLPAVWEAIPWSFFVDYFVNVNEVLDALQWATKDVGWVNRRVKNDNSILYSVSPGNIPKGLTYESTVTPLHLRSTYKARSPSGIPYPSLRFRLPGVKQDINIAALWASIYASRPIGWKAGKETWAPKPRPARRPGNW